ncbi:hypothetical protein RclHR1_00200049 [Rhizophagus clarus]|uniref:Uncharacterized protein n=1 Tax=Rhizophagus clarus TaxID=94130 RepID=A0A2Z6RJ57_9GLOM|nr:hypothetical protein RclHR1_00200049 [Rhizophagus clarus]GES99456.1 hypothetical protein GLOIN_2v1546864 [Rhizophagus clarus]
MSTLTSLKFFASVAIITLVGGYGLSKLYNNNNYNNNNKSHTQEHHDYEISDDTEKVLIKKSILSLPAYTNKSNNSFISNSTKSKKSSSISRNHFIIIENLIMSITTKQNQAIHFRKRYHKNLNEILKQIDDMRENICITEEEHLKKIHQLLDEIENYQKYEDINLPEINSHIKDLEKKVLQEEAYLDTELRVLQADLGMLMWKYEELEKYDLKEWNNSQLEIQQLRAKLMKDAVRFSKMKSNNNYY